jgi:hypothetical protein
MCRALKTFVRDGAFLVAKVGSPENTFLGETLASFDSAPLGVEQGPGWCTGSLHAFAGLYGGYSVSKVTEDCGLLRHFRLRQTGLTVE